MLTAALKRCRIFLLVPSGFMSKSRGSLSTPPGSGCTCDGGQVGRGRAVVGLTWLRSVSPLGESLTRAGCRAGVYLVVAFVAFIVDFGSLGLRYYVGSPKSGGVSTVFKVYTPIT